MKHMTESEKRFVETVASDFGIHGLTDADIKRAHKYASEEGDSNGQEYYDALKDFFAN